MGNTVEKKVSVYTVHLGSYLQTLNWETHRVALYIFMGKPYQ